MRLSPETVGCLNAYSYPGNVRELHNVLERLVVLCPPSNIVEPGALPREFTSGAAPAAAGMPLDTRGLTEAVEAFEWQMISRALEQADHNQAKAARILKLDRSALRYKLRKYGYETPEDEAA